jgi:hypothetical protein
MFAKSAVSMAGGFQAIAEKSRTGKAGTKSVLRSTHNCQISFSSINYSVIYSYWFKAFPKWIIVYFLNDYSLAYICPSVHSLFIIIGCDITLNLVGNMLYTGWGWCCENFLDSNSKFWFRISAATRSVISLSPSGQRLGYARLIRDYLFPKIFQSTIHLSSYHSTLRSLAAASVVKQPTKQAGFSYLQLAKCF